MSKQKKRITVGIIVALFLILALALGETLYMRSKEHDRIELEKQTAIEIKDNVKNVKKITITDFYESSPGIKNVDFDVEETDGTVIRGNSIIVGSFGFHNGNGLKMGRTNEKVKVIYTTGEEAVIE
ncbi:hypothetical protein [Lactococcus ileimucosae]|uniref:hypothetical protein n=1 Tax=Lactococcus ileimucosae TaxID=2941329 RepID=UPI002043CC0E|nr:hypothetical protein [Lactococcus ileimucosae]